MDDHSEVYVRLYVAEERHAVAVADSSRQDEVRYLGEISAAPVSVRQMVTRLEKRHRHLHFCFEAGPARYGLCRQIVGMGHRCTVVAPSLMGAQMKAKEAAHTATRLSGQMELLRKLGSQRHNGTKG